MTIDKPPKWTAHHFPKGTVFEYLNPETGTTYTETVRSVCSKQSLLNNTIETELLNEELGVYVNVLMRFVIRVIKRGNGPVVYGERSLDKAPNTKFFDKWLCEDGKIRKSHSVFSLRRLLTRTVRKIDPQWEHKLNNEGLYGAVFIKQLMRQSWCKPLEPHIFGGARFTINQKKFDRFVRQNWRRWLVSGKKTWMIDPDTKAFTPVNRDFHEEGLDALAAGYTDMYDGLIDHVNQRAVVKDVFRHEPCIRQPLRCDQLPYDMAGAIPKPVVHEDISITDWVRANNPMSSEKLHSVLTNLANEKARYVIVGWKDLTNEDGTECISKPIVKRFSDV